MNLIQKTDPRGIDFVIDEIQLLLDSSLSWTDFTCYPRIYKEETQNGVKPMNYVGDGDYVDTFLDDTINGSCFFYKEDSMSATNGYFNEVKLSIVFQINLYDLYPSITHRADEEAHRHVMLALNSLPTTKVEGLVTRINNVYSEFSTTQVQLDDIGEFHVFRVDMSVIVDYQCK